MAIFSKTRHWGSSMNSASRRLAGCWLALPLALVIVVLGGCEPAENQESAPPGPAANLDPPVDRPTPNIIMVMIDTLRADCLGCYGNTSGNTPNIDEIAAQGVTIQRVISAAPWTQPSIASFFSSLYPGVHKVVNYAQAFNATFRGKAKVVVFDDSFETLAESLQVRGYATAAFVANPFILSEYGFAQGFDHFDSRFANNTTPGRVVNDAAVEWIQQRDVDKPFFAYLHYMDPHGPYDAEAQFLNPLLDGIEQMPNKTTLTDKQFESLKYLLNLPKGYLADKERHDRLNHYREYWMARYQAGVRQADHHLGGLAAKLSELGLWEDAYIIITSDHGEALCEHDLWEHGWSVHHTDAHIPMVLRWPTGLPSGVRVQKMLRSIDLMPTILDHLGLTGPAGMQGTTMAPFFENRPPSTTLDAFIESVKMGQEQKGIYVGNFKLMTTPATRWMGLYDIDVDPYEQHNLLGQYPQRVNELKSLLQQQLTINQSRAQGFIPATANLTKEQRDRLRSLGYIEGPE